jgi:hypothetical protein
LVLVTGGEIAAVGKVAKMVGEKVLAEDEKTKGEHSALNACRCDCGAQGVCSPA